MAPAGAAFGAAHDTTLVSRASSGAKANGSSVDAAASGDGRYVAFWSTATNLSPDDEYRTSTCIAATASRTGRSWSRARPARTGPRGGASATRAGDLRRWSRDRVHVRRAQPTRDAGTAYDIFVRDVDAGETSRLPGIRAGGAARPELVSGACDLGREAVRGVRDGGVEPCGEQPTVSQVYVRDRQTETTTLVSRATGAAGAPASAPALAPAISEDGRAVAFMTRAKLSPDDHDARWDAYLRDLAGGTTTLVSRAASGKTGGRRRRVGRPGAVRRRPLRHVRLDRGQDLSVSPIPIRRPDVYVRDRATSTTTLVSRATGAAGAAGNGYASARDLGRRRRIAFISDATNLSAADVNAVPDVFVRDIVANTTTLISAPAAWAGRWRTAGGRTGDLRRRRAHRVRSMATNLSVSDTTPDGDQYVRELPSLARPPLGAARRGGRGEAQAVPAGAAVDGVCEFKGSKVFTDQVSGLPDPRTRTGSSRAGTRSG